MGFGGLFDPDNKKKRIEHLESEINKPNFWNDKKDSEKILNELNFLKNKLFKLEKLKTNIESNIEILIMLKENMDLEMKKIVELDIPKITDDLNIIELDLLLNGPYDSCDCLLEIHPGAGGTESCDWALMLYRMYKRWCEKNNKKIELLDYQGGEEAGIKSVSFIVHGLNSYGYLKNEKGVHRLIRISPFDSNKRRHTSFASIDITPLYNDENIDIELKEPEYHEYSYGFEEEPNKIKVKALKIDEETKNRYRNKRY